MKKTTFREICQTRQRTCLAYLDKIISSPPSDMKKYISKYNALEESWKLQDQQLDILNLAPSGYHHERFIKMNNQFRETLNRIGDEMDRGSFL